MTPDAPLPASGPASSPGSTAAGAHVAADVEAVEAANAAFYDAVERADAGAMALLWDEVRPDDVSCAHPGWPALRGRGPVLRSWAAVMAGSDYLQFLLSDVQVAVEGDTAVVTCTENILTGTGGTAGMVGATSAVNVYRRRPDGWRLQVHHAGPLLQGDGEPDR